MLGAFDFGFKHKHVDPTNTQNDNTDKEKVHEPTYAYDSKEETAQENGNIQENENTHIIETGHTNQERKDIKNIQCYDCKRHLIEGNLVVLVEDEKDHGKYSCYCGYCGSHKTRSGAKYKLRCVCVEVTDGKVG